MARERPRMVNFRADDVEFHLIRALAAKRGCSVSEVLRTLVLGEAREVLVGSGDTPPAGVK
jgi:hypothetical protein